MKKVKLVLFSFVFTSLTITGNGQDRNQRIEIFYAGLGENDIVRFDDLIGAAGYNGQDHFSVGVNYIRPLSGALDFETGLEYGRHQISIHPNLPPTADVAYRTEKLLLLTLPSVLSVDFLHYFFLKGGALLDFDLSDSSVDSQTGIGAALAIGFKYDFKYPLSLSISPYARMHSLIPFSPDEYHQRLLENGIRFGLGYRF